MRQSGLSPKEDPIGIAGGLNLYGYADGDPINFSDPFGLCPEGEEGATCEWLVAELRKLEGSEFQRAAAAYDLLSVPVVLGSPGENPDLRDDPSGYSLGKVVKEPYCSGGQCGLRDARVVLNSELPEGDFLITAVHETYHLNLRGNLPNKEIRPHELAALKSLPQRLKDLAPHYRQRHGIR